MNVPGPAGKPAEQKRRRNAPRANTVRLPAEGRQKPAPRWPLNTIKARGWDEIWKLPQAVMWERMHAENIVARYVELRERVSDPDFPESKNASFWNQLNNLEDRLGLTPMAMLRLQWEICGTEETGTETVVSGDEQDGNAHVINLRERVAQSE